MVTLSDSLVPYYEEPGLVLFCCSNEDVLPYLSGVDLVFTSPPYNLGGEPWPHLGNWRQGDSAGGKSKWRNGSDGSVGVMYLSHGDTIPWVEYVAWQRHFLKQAWDTLSDTGAIFYNHKPRVIGGRLWLPLELNPDLPLRQIIIWARSGGMNFTPTAFLPTHEWIMVIAKEAFRLKSRGASGIGGGDVWRVSQKRDKSHPAPFPVELPGNAIDAVAPLLVLDPFAGVGNTLIAAKKAGVGCIGIERSEEYCRIAVERLSTVSVAVSL